MKRHVKVAITGAAGQIGYALLFRVASGQMFGPDVTLDLQLLELEPALPALEGVAMELTDCAFGIVRKVVCTSNLDTAVKDADWVVAVGAVPRKEGMERSDLLKVNGGIFGPLGKAINDHAAEDVRLFVVGNPCNTNCLIAMHHAPRVPKENFFAMTMLDENRARAQLAIKAKAPVFEVQRMAIWGNHSTTQYPDFYNATINGYPVLEIIKDEKWLQDEFVPMIQKRGAQVIKARGASSAASAANAALVGVHRLVHDTAEGNIVSVGRYSQGEYGVDPGLIYSFPCVVKDGKVTVAEGFQHNDFARRKIQESLDELRKEKEAVVALGLIDATV